MATLFLRREKDMAVPLGIVLKMERVGKRWQHDWQDATRLSLPAETRGFPSSPRGEFGNWFLIQIRETCVKLRANDV
jgi:hypothetical protein